MDHESWSGHLILVVAPPGCGKSTLISHLRANRADIKFAVSCTSRPIRPGEVDGENYYFLTEAEFLRRIEAGDFLEWIQQDGGRYYGTLKSEIIDRIKRGEVVVREVEVRGADAIRELLPTKNLSTIFITAGTWEEMAARIQARAPITADELEYRRQRFEREMPFKEKADHIVMNRNGDLERSKQDFLDVVDAIVNKVKASS